MSKGNLIIMIGFQGSGKTTLSRKLASKYNWVRIGVDDLKAMVGDIENRVLIRKEIEVISTIYNLKKGRTVILDKMALSRDNRVKMVRLYREFADKIIAVVLNTPLHKCMRNNKNRTQRVSVKSYAERLSGMDPVTGDEGFDEIIYVES